MPSTQQRSIRLFQFAGIDVFLHWSWFLVAAYEISSRARSYSSLRWNALEYLALFLIVMLHEFGHALACLQVGGTVNKIVLWPLGGTAYVNPPPRPGATLWSIAAGPLVNVALLAVLGALGMWGRRLGWAHTLPDVYRMLVALWFINLALLIFNLLPIYPLDGGQILRSLLWFVLGRARSLTVVTIIGFLGASGLIILAVRSHSVWIGAISVFMLMNCWAGLQQAQLLSRVAKRSDDRSQSSRTNYTEITEPKLQERLRARYHGEIASLQTLGFSHLSFFLEVLGPYSAILQFPLVLLMRRDKSIMVFPSPFRLAVADVLLVHSNPASIAECMGKGIKFYARFSDGSLLISPTFQSHAIPGPNSPIIKNAPGRTIEDSWLSHRKRLVELEAQGKDIHDSSSFGDYVEMSRREADLSQYV